MMKCLLHSDFANAGPGACQTPGASQLVSEEQFLEYARFGRQLLVRLQWDPIHGNFALDRRMAAKMREAVQVPWGGLTVFIRGHLRPKVVKAPKDRELFAMAVGNATEALPLEATELEIRDAARRVIDSPAMTRASCVGIFRNEVLQQLHVDPVILLSSREAVDAVGAATRCIGGAYCFNDGLGYWPPHVAVCTCE